MSDINGLGDYYSDYSKTDKRADALSSKLSSTDYSKATDDEMMDACKQFEEYFVEQTVKAMKKMATFEPKEDEDKSGKEGSEYLDMFEDTMVTEAAKMITEKADLGLAKQLYEQMRRNYPIEEVNVSETTNEVSEEAITAASANIRNEE